MNVPVSCTLALASYRGVHGRIQKENLRCGRIRKRGPCWLNFEGRNSMTNSASNSIPFVSLYASLME
jgi:hypothetical protein